MKILFIHNFYTQYGGEDAVVNSQIALLANNGHEIIHYFRKSTELDQMFMGKIRSFFSAMYNPRSIKEIKAILEQQKPDLVHVHNLFPLISPAIMLLIKKANVPIVMTVHNYRLICPNGLFFSHNKICESCTGKRKELNCILKNCEGSQFKSCGYALRNWWARKKQYYSKYVDVFACLTEFQKEKLSKNGYPIEKLKVIPNMFALKINDKEVNTGSNTEKYIAVVGRISPEKGIDLILKAAKLIPNIEFRLAGGIKDGYSFDVCPENVKLVGLLNNDELSTFYKNAYLLVLASTCYEGFPMVFPEAMNYSLPIIAPKMAGFPEVIEHEVNGLLFEPGNAEDLAKQISILHQEPYKAMEYGKNGYMKLQKKYTPEVYYQNLLSLYSDLIN